MFYFSSRLLYFYFCLTFSYRQAQATVLQALPLLNKYGISTKRPDDYFAEMAKSDQQMQKVSGFHEERLVGTYMFVQKSQQAHLNIFFLLQIRKKLISKQMILERSEKAKKLREQRKFGKKVGVYFISLLLMKQSINCGPFLKRPRCSTKFMSRYIDLI